MLTTPSTRTEESPRVRQRTIARPPSARWPATTSRRSAGGYGPFGLESSGDRAMAPESSGLIRVLIADRNARLLESISLTFARQFSIHTADTLERCGDCLRQSHFDLVIVCEKLADGPGLPLLGEIARHSPGTLRIFAARRSKLELLAGKLGPFGLFRTLSYPIDARRLMSSLTLARTALMWGAPGLSSAVRQPRNGVSHSQAIALLLARLQPPRLVPPRFPLEAKQPAPSQSAILRPAIPAFVQSQSAPVQRVLARPEAARKAGSKASGEPSRFLVFLAATIVVVFLLATLAFRQPDSSPQLSDTQATPVTKVSDAPALHSQMAQPDSPAPYQVSKPASPKPSQVSPRADVAESESQVSPASTPIADPSTFGSEAAEPIYAN